MIENDEEKYDFEDHSFSDTVKRNSTCYSPSEVELKNIQLVEDYLDGNKYKDRHMVEVHIEYLENLLNKLQNARREEFAVCPTNVELDQEIGRVQQLSRRLAAKLSEFMP